MRAGAGRAPRLGSGLIGLRAWPPPVNGASRSLYHRCQPPAGALTGEPCARAPFSAELLRKGGSRRYFFRNSMARLPVTPWPTRPGSVFFGDVASDCRQRLTRATKDGRIRRLARGLYSVDLRMHEGRYLPTHDDEDGFNLQARLSSEDGALVRKALEAAMEAGDSGSAEPISPGMTLGSSTWPTPCIAYGGDPPWLVVMAESFLATGPKAGTGGDRHPVSVHVDADVLAGNAGGRYQLEAVPPRRRRRPGDWPVTPPWWASSRTARGTRSTWGATPAPSPASRRSR